jgi:Rrf2 family transcriptional regulator, iron-sulfur cluster assembly transcription factor
MLSQTATYALRAMGYLAEHRGKGPILSKTIADAQEIPRNFLSKIMHRLAQEGLVESVRGINGGFSLIREPNQIRLRDIVSQFMDLDRYETCLLGRAGCDGKCGLHKTWKPISAQIAMMLENTTLDQLA